MSLSSSHDHLLKLHALCELDAMSGFGSADVDSKVIIQTLNERLDKIGSFTEDKQYVLGIRRAVMQLSKSPKYVSLPDVETAGLTFI
jgi:serine/threonine-protein kinase ATR